MEGDGDHAGELPASLHPEVPAQTLLPPKLLQADHLKSGRSLTYCGETEGPALRPGDQTRIHPLSSVLNFLLGNEKDGTALSGVLLRGFLG